MKFKLTENTKTCLGIKLFQIEALVDFKDIKRGDLGGWLEKEENLSQHSNARVSGDAQVSGNARVSGDAWVLWFSKVGSGNGTLTAWMDKDNNISVNRGCFTGTLSEFRKATEGSTKEIQEEYKLLADFIELRFKNVLSKQKRGLKP